MLELFIFYFFAALLVLAAVMVITVESIHGELVTSASPALTDPVVAGLNVTVTVALAPGSRHNGSAGV